MNDHQPLVSVIIPVYNGTNYLREAIDSVLSQTYTNHEILVVDDGSTDSTWGIIQLYGEKVRGFQKKNGGVASALNHGIREMRGEWFAWLSHDDLWMPQKLERQVDFLIKNREFQACYTDCNFINSTGEIIRTMITPWYKNKEALWIFFFNNYINGSSIMIHRNIFESVGFFNEKLLFCQDGEMWIRIFINNDIGRIPEILVTGRVHPDQGSCKSADHHRAEVDMMYYDIFFGLLEKGIFPPSCIDNLNSNRMSCAMKWLGIVNSRKGRRFGFANLLFKKSIQYDPSLLNTARIWLIINNVLPFFYLVTRKCADLKRQLMQFS